MELPVLSRASLVGGTALSLRHGHRTSVDLDLFIAEGFDREQIASHLKEHFGERFRYENPFNNIGVSPSLTT